MHNKLGLFTVLARCLSIVKAMACLAMGIGGYWFTAGASAAPTFKPAVERSMAGAQRLSDLSPQVQAFVAVGAPHIVIQHVRLIDGTGVPARADVSVVIRDGRIARIAPATDVQATAGAHPEAHIIDGSGQTLTPGFVMLHEHMFYPSGQGRYNTNQFSFPPLYLAGGATTIRTGGSVDPYTDLRIRKEIDAGRLPGPKIDVTGPYLEGPDGFIWGFPELKTPAQARAHVNFWVDQGVTSFKSYTHISRAALGAGIEAAHARGIKVTGHLCSVTYREAADLGIDNLEHGFFAATDWAAGKRPDECPAGNEQVFLDLDLTSPAFTDLVKHLIDKGVALTSTLTVVEPRVPGRPVPPEGALAAILPELREQVLSRLARRGEEPNKDGGRLLTKYMQMEKAFYDAGGLLVVGTDPTGRGSIIPGYANQRAVQLLMEMGLTVEQAIEVATRNGARYLGLEEQIGTVEVGKRADLILMQGDPGADPEALRSMTIVFKDGIGYDSAKLFDSVRGWVGVR